MLINKRDNLKIVCSNVDLSGLEVETANENRRAFLLKDKIGDFVNSKKNAQKLIAEIKGGLSILYLDNLPVIVKSKTKLQAEFLLTKIKCHSELYIKKETTYSKRYI